jgi:hypothetical protein
MRVPVLTLFLFSIFLSSAISQSDHANDVLDVLRYSLQCPVPVSTEKNKAYIEWRFNKHSYSGDARTFSDSLTFLSKMINLTSGDIATLDEVYVYELAVADIGDVSAVTTSAPPYVQLSCKNNADCIRQSCKKAPSCNRDLPRSNKNKIFLCDADTANTVVLAVRELMRINESAPPSAPPPTRSLPSSADDGLFDTRNVGSAPSANKTESKDRLFDMHSLGDIAR